MNKLHRRKFLQSTALASAALTSRLSAAPTQDVRWLEEIQQSPQVIPPDAPKLSDLLNDNEGRRITSLDAWKAERERIRRWWIDFLGPLPAERKAAPKLT